MQNNARALYQKKKKRQRVALNSKNFSRETKKAQCEFIKGKKLIKESKSQEMAVRLCKLRLR